MSRFTKIFILIFLSVLFISISSSGQFLHCDWKTESSIGSCLVIDGVADANGNYLAFGIFQEINIQGLHLIADPPDRHNMFVSKFDLDSTMMWIKQIATGATNYAWNITCDSESNIIISGEFDDTILLCDTSYTAPIGYSNLLIKLDSMGNCLWSKHVLYGHGNDFMPIVVDSEDNIYAFTANETNIDGNICSGITVVSKLSPVGEVLWMKAYPIDVFNHVGRSDITVTISNDRIYFGGWYRDTISFAGTQYISQMQYLIDPFTGDTLWYSSAENMVGAIDTDGNEITAVEIFAYGSLRVEAVIANEQGMIGVAGIYEADTLFFRDSFLTNGEAYFMIYDEDLDLLAYNNIDDFTIKDLAITDSYVYFLSIYMNKHKILKYDLDCNFVDSVHYGTHDYQSGWLKSLIPVSNNTLILGGAGRKSFWVEDCQLSQTNMNDSRMFILKLTDYMVGIDEVAYTFPVNVYPNPVTDRLHINIENCDELQVFDLTGKLIHSLRNTNEVDFRQYKGGLYIIQVVKDNEVHWVKVVKQ